MRLSIQTVRNGYIVKEEGVVPFDTESVFVSFGHLVDFLHKTIYIEEPKPDFRPEDIEKHFQRKC